MLRCFLSIAGKIYREKRSVLFLPKIMISSDFLARTLTGSLQPSCCHDLFYADSVFEFSRTDIKGIAGAGSWQLRFIPLHLFQFFQKRILPSHRYFYLSII